MMLDVLSSRSLRSIRISANHDIKHYKNHGSYKYMLKSNAKILVTVGYSLEKTLKVEREMSLKKKIN